MDRLYAKGSPMDGGTLLQLRNLINRRNVGKDVSKRFNACIDFMETVIHCHITAAALNYFCMTKVDDQPTSADAFLLCKHSEDEATPRKWELLHTVVGDIVDRFVLVKDFIGGSHHGQHSQ